MITGISRICLILLCETKCLCKSGGLSQGHRDIGIQDLSEPLPYPADTLWKATSKKEKKKKKAVLSYLEGNTIALKSKKLNYGEL